MSGKVINVAKSEDNAEALVFNVTVGTYHYKVTMARDYHRKLTNGKLSPEALVKKSFEFLLEREGPGSILSEFDISLIAHYFPDYEKVIKQK